MAGTGSNGDDLARYYPQVRRYLERHASRTYPVDDLVHDTFLRAYETVRDRGPPDDPLSWLKGVAHHVVADRFRGRRAWEDSAYPLDDNVADRRSHSDPIAAVIAEEQSTRIGRALRHLSRYDAALIHGHYVLGLSCRDLANDRRISESAAKGALYRARRRLRALVSTGNTFIAASVQ